MTDVAMWALFGIILVLTGCLLYSIHWNNKLDRQLVDCLNQQNEENKGFFWLEPIKNETKKDFKT